MKVLIADDHAQMREIIRKLVLSLPEVESVIECENGEEALSISIKEQPDLILMDLLMKKMDGFTAIKKIKSAGVLSKIIVVSQISE
ncbi:MAG: DNA-binding response regulator, partial [Flavobacterium sp.]|nr:DNA-binding response regulator [Flavobacterium sp.]